MHEITEARGRQKQNVDELIERLNPVLRGWNNLTGDGRFAFYVYDVRSDDYAPFSALPGQEQSKASSPAIRVGGPNRLRAVPRSVPLTSRRISDPRTPVRHDLRARGSVGLYVSAGNRVEYSGFTVTR